MLAPYFLPRRRVGAWRPFKFAIHLRAHGWEPHVIAIRHSGGTLTDRERRRLAPVSVYPINPPFDFTHQIGRQLEFNGRSEEAAGHEGQKNALEPILNWIDKHFPVDTWLPLFMWRRGQIEQYIESIDPQLLWSTGDPWSSHWLARRLAEKYQLPWIADFRDPWTLGDLRLKNRSEFACRIDRAQEQKVVREASVLTFTSRQTEALYNRKYAAEISNSATIYNSYDSTFFKHNSPKQPYFNDDELNLVFFGRFRPLSPARPFIEVMEVLRRRAPEAAAMVRMHSFGTLSREDRALAHAKGVESHFVHFKPIPLEDALPLLTQSDILWLSTHPRRENIIPAKLWDYLAARRPILSVAPNPEIEAILDQTGAGCQIESNDKDALVDLLIECAEAKRASREMPIPTAFDDEMIKQYDADVATQKLAAIFDRLT